MTRITPERLIPALAIVAILIGCMLRFTALDHKVYWHDEAHTALRVSGNTTQSFVDSVFVNRTLSAAELLEFQHPTAAQGFQDSLRSLMSRPEHGPLYYLLARAGFLFTDDAKLATRSVAALLSLLLLPAAAWLWRELFFEESPGNRRQGQWVVMALLALSPFQLVYAQEARQYSLWAAMTLVVCAALLRAHRRGAVRDWMLYAFTVAVGLYTHLMLAVVVLTHALWLGWVAPARLKHFAAAIALAALLFSPWLMLFHSGLREVGQVTDWMKVVIPFERLSNAWGLHLVRQFVDTAAPTPQPWLSAVLLLLAFALYRTARSAPIAAKRLLFLLLVITVGVVVGPDLLQGGRRSQEARYLLPAFLMLMFMVAFAFTHALGSRRKWVQGSAMGLWVGLLGLGLWSDLGYVQAETWWNKSMSSHNAEVARHIDAASQPLVICPNGDINPGEVLSLAHEVTPETRFLLTEYEYLPVAAQLQGDVFLLNSSAGFREHFARYGQVKEVHKQGRLWRFIPRS
jgi:uncharacterized membrane protein